MAGDRKSWLRRVIIYSALLAAAVVSTAPLWKGKSKPLGDAPRIEFPATEMSQLARQQFLDGDFLNIKNVKALPRPVLQAFTEEGGSRLVMVNPGKKFEATDAIDDSSLPNRRLIFAGVVGDRCFVHYEQGGIVHIYILALFRLKSSDSIEPLWRGYCGPAANVQGLRSQVAKGECSNPVPREMR
jgi:hypothetical protein